VLADHRRAFVYSLVLLGATAALFVLVGLDPRLPVVQPVDDWWFGSAEAIRSTPALWIARAMDLAGGAYVTLPIRVGVAIWLLALHRWRKFSAWVLTWAASEIVVTFVKLTYDRPRPPGSLVSTSSSSFPSGHATAAAATAVALVLVLLPPGPRRRKWEALAVAFTFLMSLSRTYLQAHWLTDVLAGSLLGAGIAIGSAALITEVRDVALRRQARHWRETSRSPP